MNEFINYLKYFFVDPYSSELFNKFEDYIWNIDIIGFGSIFLGFLFFGGLFSIIIGQEFLKLYLGENIYCIFLDKYTLYKKIGIAFFIGFLPLMIFSHIVLFILN